MVLNLPYYTLITIIFTKAPLYKGNLTSIFISEALYPFNIFKKASFKVNLALEIGKYSIN